MLRTSTSPAVVVLDQLRCGGRTLSRRACAPVKLRESAGGHTAQKFSAQRDEIYLMTDSLVVRSMVGGSGHGAGASCAGYTDHMDSLDGVFAY